MPVQNRTTISSTLVRLRNVGLSYAGREIAIPIYPSLHMAAFALCSEPYSSDEASKRVVRTIYGKPMSITVTSPSCTT